MSLGMNRRLLIAAALVAFVAILGVALWLSQPPAQLSSGPIDCGTAGDNQPWVFNCLVDAYSRGRIAKGIIVSPTLEGDVVIYTVSVVSRTSLQVVVDDRDPHGQPGIYGYSCSWMSKIAPTPNVEYYRLVLKGCTGKGPLGPGPTLTLPS
jgi:hypothetical protein